MEFLVVIVMMVLLGSSIKTYGAINKISWRNISYINNQGPYIGIVVPNVFELNPLLQSSSFLPHNKIPYFDFAGRHFRIGELKKKKIIVVVTGESMLNAGLATQLLLTLFNVKGVLHYGIAGNLNSKFQIGDVTIPQYWAHTGLWNWQRFEENLKNGDGVDFSRDIGYLKFSDYNNYTKNSILVENLLNKVWFQPEEISTIDGTPEVFQKVFWVPVDQTYFEIARKLNNVKLSSCVNKTCLPRNPNVVRVKKGVSSSVFVDNKAYRELLNSKFDATTNDMESASVALVCFQHKIPFIAIRALSDLAGGGSSLTNEVNIFISLASQNAFDVLVKFISLL